MALKGVGVSTGIRDGSLFWPIGSTIEVLFFQN
jgi:hypothetical protein